MSKSSPFGFSGNLKGKKTKLLSCGCCDAYNSKEEQFCEIAWKEAKEEIKDFEFGTRSKVS